jgi:hypothetical protein
MIGRPVNPDRTINGYRVEHDLALREGKIWVAERVRKAAAKLAAKTGVAVPEWAQDAPQSALTFTLSEVAHRP